MTYKRRGTEDNEPTALLGSLYQLLHMGFRFGVATASLGFHENHTIESKFLALERAGFHHVCVGFEDYVNWVRLKQPNLYANPRI